MQSMQHIIMLFSRSTIQHQNAKLIWHGRKQLLNSIAIQFFRIYAYGYTSTPPAGAAAPGWATTTQLTAAIMSLHELLSYSNSY
jgi:hypothetical protein